MQKPQTGDLFGGKYRLTRRLAQGGMGSVWAAEHLTLGTAVAVKLMMPDALASPGLRARFEREAKAAAQLKSPHVVTIHDYGVESGVPYIVMEVLEGEDLGARLRRVRRLSLPDTIAIAVPVAKALVRAHAAGVVHRDLKPGNVFLARVDQDEIVKVLDFGIAKASIGPHGDAETTSADAMLGSPSYMSPEQVRGARDVDHRTDLWSFGVILFRVLTGSLPFKSEASGDLLVRICTDPVPSARRLAPELPEEIDDFFERALARDPAGRYASAGDLVRALMAAASPDAVTEPLSIRASLASLPIEPRAPRPEAKPGAVAQRSDPEPGTLTEAGSQVTPRESMRAHPRTLLGVGVGAASLVLALGLWAMLHRRGRAEETAPAAIATGSPGARPAAAAASPPDPIVTPAVPPPTADASALASVAPSSGRPAPTSSRATAASGAPPSPPRPSKAPKNRLPLGL